MTFDGILLYVSDLRRSIHFYRDLLGLSLEGEPGADNARFRGDCRLIIHTSQSIVSSKAVILQFSSSNIGVLVSRLREEGYVDFRGPDQLQSEFRLRLTDPDGHQLAVFGTL
jgi:lactoylglutathione lyase